jgi:hypothetical protein
MVSYNMSIFERNDFLAPKKEAKEDEKTNRARAE